jgi:NADPH-dependent 2,4-dienoyl-CoA reductase/sulfur reductase-like enzyme/nitrite reductase/ring-hydroxylating ferredoxin subunit
VKILLLRENGKYYATGAKCSHYGAPLVNGSFCGGRVRCPWHGACFNIKNGDIEDFPGLDSIPSFEVVITGGQIHVRANKSKLDHAKRVKTTVAHSSCDKTVVLIIGGGPAAAVCAETLRQEGFQGQIIVATKESHLPYDRPKLSKVLAVTPEQIALRDKAYYDSNNIEFKFNMEATGVDAANKTVQFKDGSTITYTKLVLATGTYARTFTTIPGHDLENIKTLRSVDDAQFIAAHATGKDVVIMGTSFIGVEVTAALVDKAKSVTIFDVCEVPFQLALGKEVGTAVKKLLDGKGVKSHFQTTVSEFVGSEGKLTQVVLKDGTILSADLCVLGVGVLPVTDFLKSSGVNISERGFVVVDKNMKTNLDDVYAIGDIAQFPLFIANDDSVNIQHWQMAHQHGRVCALNIAGKKTDVHSVPFFWTALFGKSLRYTGYGFGYDDIIFHGDLNEPKFVAFYTKGDKVIAVASMNMDPVAAQAAQMMQHKQTITKSEVQSEPLGWTKRIQGIAECTHL